MEEIMEIEGVEPEPELTAEAVLAELWGSLSCLPCCKRDFVGDEIYRNVQTILYGSCDIDEEDEEEYDEAEEAYAEHTDIGGYVGGGQ